MFGKQSRYKDAKLFTENDNAERVFDGVRARDIGPAQGVIEHEVRHGDRLDLLALHYYNNDRLWWRIVDANPDIQFSQKLLDDSMGGRVILIPKASE